MTQVDRRPAAHIPVLSLGSCYIVFACNINKMGIPISVYIRMQHDGWMNCRVNKQQTAVLYNNMAASEFPTIQSACRLSIRC